MKKVKLTKSQQKALEKQLKKVNPVYWVLVFVFLIVGAVAGYFAVTNLTKNDLIELNGETTRTYFIDEGVSTYVDEGVKAIIFGKELSKDNIKIESNLQQTESGFIIPLNEENIYYIKYTINHITFGEVVKYRTIIVEANND